MLLSYLKLAIRNMAKNRLYAAINVIGLAIGLSVYLLANIISEYENNHDHMFEKRSRIFTVSSIFDPGANVGVRQNDGAYSALAPLIETEVGELEGVARVIKRQYLVGQNNRNFYQHIRFADPAFSQIFNFNYLQGDASALNTPDGLIITASTAKKFFGRTDVLGEILSLNLKNDLRVAAVIEDVAADSHFNSALIVEGKLTLVAPMSVLSSLENFNLDGNWNNLSMGNLTYALIPEDQDRQWLQAQIDSIYERLVPEFSKRVVSHYEARPLIEANTHIWEAIGLPLIQTVKLLGLLVLIIACVNYTNLATAQSFGRAREVGLRKTFGADRSQLLVQFLVESLATAAMAMVIALSLIEFVIPWFNQSTGKVLSINYIEVFPWLAVTTLAVGLLAGAYPAYMITRNSPLQSLKGTALKAAGGNQFRNIMIGVQFAISIFMLALVIVVYAQNQKIQSSGTIFPMEKIITMGRVEKAGIQPSHQALKQALLALPGVSSVSYSSQVPFEQSNNTGTMTPVSGDRSAEVSLNRIAIDTDFLETYDIPLVAGRNFDLAFSADMGREGVRQNNVILNQLAAKKLGLGQGESVIGKRFFDTYIPEGSSEPVGEYTVIGLLPDQNFLGLHNKLKPIVFYMNESHYRTGSIRFDSDDIAGTLAEIDRVWADVIKDYPIQRRFLDEVFQDVFFLMENTSSVLAGFAALALTLALIGLFGLAAFMAERRTREIGIRKVLGARVRQIVLLLIWQFSIPVLWSLLVALPLAYAASSRYLDFFPDRLDIVAPIIVLAGAVGLLAAWIIVSVHAYRIALKPPITSLRHE